MKLLNKEKLRDEILNVNTAETARAVMATADALQNYPASVQLAALAYGFIALIRLTKQNPQDTFTAVHNAAASVDGIRPEFKAAEEYIRREILHEED